MTLDRGNAECRGPIRLLRVNVHLCIEQLCDHLNTTVPSSIMQCRPTAFSLSEFFFNNRRMFRLNLSELQYLRYRIVYRRKLSLQSVGGEEYQIVICEYMQTGLR